MDTNGTGEWTLTFEELLERLADDYLNPDTLPDGTKLCDRNGHRRLAELQAKYGLSSMKVQKLLVTAGVYRPVKADASYFTVKRLHEAGKSPAEIMAETGLSDAVVNACLPYGRGAKELDRLGVAISGAAARKRKQRGREERKKENARGLLGRDISDENFRAVVMEHAGEVFLTSAGERYSYRADGDGITVGERRFGWEDVLAVLHGAVELAAAGRAEEAAEADFAPAAALEWVYPLLVCFGIVGGDAGRYAVKRGGLGTEAIRAALAAGPDPALSALPTEVLLRRFRESAEAPDGRYADGQGNRLGPGDFGPEAGRYLFSAADARGEVHRFRLGMREEDLPGGGRGRLFTAAEVHRLTKAGKVAADSTGTDYEFTLLRDARGDAGRAVPEGFLELEETIRRRLRRLSLRPAEAGPDSVEKGKGRWSLAGEGQAEPVTAADGKAAFRLDGMTFSAEEAAILAGRFAGGPIVFQAGTGGLAEGQGLMPVELTEKALARETAELLACFSTDGGFERERDREGFTRMFETYVLPKLRLYHRSRPGGYGRLAGAEILRRLERVRGTEAAREAVREAVKA